MFVPTSFLGNNIVDDKNFNISEKTEDMYFNYLLNISSVMFKYENLPDSIDAFYLEFIMQTRGFCIITKDQSLGVVALEATMGGKLNHYYLPTFFRGVDPTGILNKEYMLDDVVIFKNSPLYTPLVPQLRYYAKQLALCSDTINVNLDAQWTPYIIQGDKRAMNQFNNFIKKIRSGVKTIFTAKNHDIMGSLQVLPTQAPFVALDVNEAKQSILRECMTFLGIDNSNQDKRERVQSAEVYSNNTQIIASRNIWLSQRQEAVKKLNKKYNLDVSVTFRPYEEMETLMNMNEMTLEEMVVNDDVE